MPEASRRDGSPARSLHTIALCTHPLSAPATRLRLAQFLPPLDAAGVRVSILPFLTERQYELLYDRTYLARNAAGLIASLLRRLAQLPRILSAQLLFVQREAMLFGPPWIEWLAARVAGVPMVLDLDDPTWVPVPSPVYGRLGTIGKWPGKTDRLIRWSRTVICGNETIAEHVRALGTSALILPTIVDTDVFRPRCDAGERQAIPVVGWIGSHSTWPFLEPLLPLLEEVAASVPFRLRIIGSGREEIAVRGVETEVLPWRLDREVQDFQSLDVGLYPMPEDSWTVGKSGLKLVEYLATGVPSIASPVGIVRSIGVAGETHLTATTGAEWRDALLRLLRDPEQRRAVGAAGRRYAVEHYAMSATAGRLARILRAAAGEPAQVFA